MELSTVQRKIVESESDKIIVLSAAAAGKTEVLTQRVKRLLDNGADPKKIVVFTFTNAAAEVMRERIGEKGKDMFINTVHSYANFLLVSHGYETHAVLDNEDFDRLFSMVKQHPDCIEDVDYVFLDEAQDSNELQFEFILDLIDPENVLFVGDLKQSIYGFNDARPDILQDMVNSGLYTVYDMDENYRNGPKILEFAKKLIKGCTINDEPLYDYSICMNEFVNDTVIETEYSLDYISNTIKKKGEYKEWFVLTRSNAMLDTIYNHLQKTGVPCDTFKRAQLTTAEFNQKMNEDTVKVLTVHTAKGLEKDYVIVVGVPKWSREGEERRVAYVAATRAKKLLIWMKKPQKKKVKMF